MSRIQARGGRSPLPQIDSSSDSDQAEPVFKGEVTSLEPASVTDPGTPGTDPGNPGTDPGDFALDPGSPVVDSTSNTVTRGAWVSG